MSTTGTDLDQALFDVLVKAADGRSFMLPGPSKLYCHQGEGGGGKTVPVNGGTDLIFKGVRLGSRSPFIFEFEQMDSDEWPVIDIESKKVEQILPKLAGHLYGVIAKAGGFADEDTSGWSLHSYFVAFKERYLAEAERIEAERAAEALVEQSERYADNDAWGTW